MKNAANVVRGELAKLLSSLWYEEVFFPHTVSSDLYCCHASHPFCLIKNSVAQPVWCPLPPGPITSAGDWGDAIRPATVTYNWTENCQPRPVRAKTARRHAVFPQRLQVQFLPRRSWNPATPWAIVEVESATDTFKALHCNKKLFASRKFKMASVSSKYSYDIKLNEVLSQTVSAFYCVK